MRVLNWQKRERKLGTNSRKTLVLLDEQIRKKGVGLAWSAPRLNSTDRGEPFFFMIAAEAVESKKSYYDCRAG